MAEEAPSAGWPKWQVGAAVGAGVAVAAAAGYLYFRSRREDIDADAPQSPSTASENNASSVGTTGSTSDAKDVRSAAPASGPGKKEASAPAATGSGQKAPEPAVEDYQKYKSSGNSLYREGNYEAAIEAYKDGLKSCPEDQRVQRSIFFQNIAATYERIAESASGEEARNTAWSQVRDSCSEALALNDKYTKAYTRRARSHFILKDYSAALDDITAANLLETSTNPTDPRPSEQVMQLATRILKELGEQKATDLYEKRPPIKVSKNFIRTYLDSFYFDLARFYGASDSLIAECIAEAERELDAIGLSADGTDFTGDENQPLPVSRDSIGYRLPNGAVVPDTAAAVEKPAEPAQAEESAPAAPAAPASGNDAEDATKPAEVEEQADGVENDTAAADPPAENHTAAEESSTAENAESVAEDAKPIPEDAEAATAADDTKPAEPVEDGDASAEASTSNEAASTEDKADESGDAKADESTPAADDATEEKEPAENGDDAAPAETTPAENSTEDTKTEEGEVVDDDDEHAPSTTEPVAEDAANGETEVEQSPDAESTPQEVSKEDALRLEGNRLYLRAILKYKNAQYALAEQASRRALLFAAEEKGYFTKAQLAHLHLIAASVDQMFSRFDTAMERLVTVIDMASSIPDELVSHALIKRGSQYLVLGKVDEGLLDFQHAGTVTPNNADVYHHRGQMHALLSHMAEAMADYQEAVKLAPDWAGAAVQQAYAMYKMASMTSDPRLMQQTMKAFKDIRSKFPDYSDGLYMYGQVMADAGDMSEAVELYQAARLADPENVSVRVHEALLVLQREQNFEKTMSALQDALTVDPHSDFVYETMAQLEVQRHNIDKAVEYWDKALLLVRTRIEMIHLYSIREATVAQAKMCKHLGIDLAAIAGEMF